MGDHRISWRHSGSSASLNRGSEYQDGQDDSPQTTVREDQNAGVLFTPAAARRCLRVPRIRIATPAR